FVVHIVERYAQFQGFKLPIPFVRDEPRDNGYPALREVGSQRRLDVGNTDVFLVVFEIRLAGTDDPRHRACHGSRGLRACLEASIQNHHPGRDNEDGAGIGHYLESGAFALRNAQFHHAQISFWRSPPTASMTLNTSSKFPAISTPTGYDRILSSIQSPGGGKYSFKNWPRIPRIPRNSPAEGGRLRGIRGIRGQFFQFAEVVESGSVEFSYPV